MKLSPVLVLALSFTVSSSLALEKLEEEEMKEITGQEGITIDRSYSITIDEIVFVDGDGAGAGVPSNNPTVNAPAPGASLPQAANSAPGYIVLKDIKVGNFVDTNMNFHELEPISVTGMKIDAVSNGVLITHGNVGE